MTHHLFSFSSVTGETGKLHIVLSCELDSDPLHSMLVLSLRLKEQQLTRICFSIMDHNSAKR